jgi:hypothetical protein
MRRKIQRTLSLYWREVILLVVSIVMTALASEVGYRLYHYWTLPDKLYVIVNAQVSDDFAGQSARPRQYLPDEHTGYVYAPNFRGQRGHPWHSQWRTNNHGHVSSFEYSQGKPQGEYRIAIIGDSMTANITNNIRWTEVLEEHLNASPRWRARTGDKTTRVINFGVDGMGMVQFAAMVRYHAVTFDPDLIVVNFVSDDILRRLRHLPAPPTTDDRAQYIRAYVKTNILDRIDWFTPRSQLLAATYGRRRGMSAELPLHANELLGSTGPLYRFASREQALAASNAAVRDIISLYPRAIFLWMPLWQELEDHRTPTPWDGLVDDIRRSVPSAKILSMHAAMGALLEGKRRRDRPDLARIKKFPQLLTLPEGQKLELHRWFFLPYDSHYSDYGTSLYAREVARYLIE